MARHASAWILLALAAGCRGKPASTTRSFDPDSLPEAFARPTAALLWPGASRAFQVTSSGHLYNGEWVVDLSPTNDGARAQDPRAIAYEGRWLPLVRWKRMNGDVLWSFEAVEFPGPAARDSGMLVSLVARATNAGAASHVARLEATLRSPSAEPPFVAHDILEGVTPPLRWASRAGTDSACGWAEGRAQGALWWAEWTLAPGVSREARLLLPVYPASARELAAAARAPHEERVAALRQYWRQTLDEGARFELQDREVETALDAARILLLSCRERRGDRWFAIGGPFQYRDVWLRDGARAIAALAVTGHTRVGRELAGGVLAFQWPQGAFLSQRGQPDGTGQALWTLEQALLRPSPDDSLSRFLPAVLAAYRWLEWQRDVGGKSGWRFGRMLPYADPRDGELVRGQLVGTDAWAIAGYRAAARLLRAAHRDPEAAEVEQARERYLADFAGALERTPSHDVPPSWRGVGRDWGNLAVGWPCGALPPDHPRLLALARRVWSESGGSGLAVYGSRDSLHGYVGADLGTWALLAGRRAEADSVLSALLHWRSACGAGAEIFTRDGGYGMNLPPHPTSAAALIALTRNCLVFDDGDTLQLTLGARDSWWRGARIRRAPTRWGEVSFEFRRLGAEARWRWDPVPVWTELTLPPGTRLAGPPPPPLQTAPSGTRVLAPPGTKTATVAIAAAVPSP